jgi:hypothetical protein
MSQSHDHKTQSQPQRTINWVFYHPKHLERQDVCMPHLYIIEEKDLDQFMSTWIPKAFADGIHRRYGFNPDEYSIQVAQVFLSISYEVVELTATGSPTQQWISWMSIANGRET